MNKELDKFKNAEMKIYINNEWLLVNSFKLKTLDAYAFYDDEVALIIYNNDKNKEIYQHIQKDVIFSLDRIGMFKVYEIYEDDEYKRIKANQSMYRFLVNGDELSRISYFDTIWYIVKKEME